MAAAVGRRGDADRRRAAVLDAADLERRPRSSSRTRSCPARPRSRAGRRRPRCVSVEIWRLVTSQSRATDVAEIGVDDVRAGPARDRVSGARRRSLRSSRCPGRRRAGRDRARRRSKSLPAEPEHRVVAGAAVDRVRLWRPDEPVGAAGAGDRGGEGDGRRRDEEHSQGDGEPEAHRRHGSERARTRGPVRAEDRGEERLSRPSPRLAGPAVGNDPVPNLAAADHVLALLVRR